MQTINWKGHGAMFGANAIWGLMSPVAKFVMLGGICLLYTSDAADE